MSEHEPAVYINPFTDFGFKKLFGTEYNKDLLIAFLNALINPATPITDLYYRPTGFPGRYQTSRHSVFDVCCHLADNSRIIVEMHNIRQEYFKDRSEYYSTFPISAEAPGGEQDFRLDPVYSVALLNFVIDQNSPECCHHEVVLTDKNTQRQFYDRLTYFYLEIPKFKKQPEELETDLERWLYVIKNLVQLSQKPAALKGLIFDRLFEAARLTALSPGERMAYDESLKAMWDDYATHQTSFNEGVEAGIAWVIARGGAQTARKMKDDGLSAAVITRYTGLSEDEIRGL